MQHEVVSFPLPEPEVVRFSDLKDERVLLLMSHAAPVFASNRPERVAQQIQSIADQLTQHRLVPEVVVHSAMDLAREAARILTTRLDQINQGRQPELVEVPGLNRHTPAHELLAVMANPDRRARVTLFITDISTVDVIAQYTEGAAVTTKIGQCIVYAPNRAKHRIGVLAPPRLPKNE